MQTEKLFWMEKLDCFWILQEILFKKQKLDSSNVMNKGEKWGKGWILQIQERHLGATGAVHMPRQAKTTVTNSMGARHFYRQLLFCKIKVRPWSCRSYPYGAPD